MTRLPVISGQRLLAVLMRAGFEVSRVESSHCVVRHADGRRTVVPVHRNEDIHRPLLRKILTQAGLSVDEYLDLLKRA